MSQVIKRFFFDDSELSILARSIRQKVFVEEQNVPAHLESDEYDQSSNHYILFYNEKPAGVARWRVTADGIKLERFAVLSEFRGKGIGSALLNSILNDVADEDICIYLNAQESAISFYLQHGFAGESDLFTEAGILHLKMIYQQ